MITSRECGELKPTLAIPAMLNTSKYAKVGLFVMEIGEKHASGMWNSTRV